MAKKKFPAIKPMTIELTESEVLGLRHIHSHWAHSNGNAPFCDAMSDQFLEKLGGYLEDCDPLWDHPIAKKWYDTNEECADCGRYFSKDQMTFHEEFDGLICQECLKDIKEN